ncbi:MAG TPA: rod-binding protein [Deltaproteobacteria bacterium]|nr:rod-binding protein [Deltaproteobacteria bacterium]HPR55127.1 rod-binding protein [Deltaproteobacteria bacterium]HXK47291.1 rod-binding protein [Deltaproteobacteria bacterium]
MITDVSLIARMNGTDPAKALEKVCAEFETMFAHQLLKTMAESVPDGFLDDGFAGDIYKDMFYQEVARNIGETGALGIRDTLRRYLQRNFGGDGISVQGEEQGKAIKSEAGENP